MLTVLPSTDIKRNQIKMVPIRLKARRTGNSIRFQQSNSIDVKKTFFFFFFYFWRKKKETDGPRRPGNSVRAKRKTRYTPFKTRAQLKIDPPPISFNPLAPPPHRFCPARCAGSKRRQEPLNDSQCATSEPYLKCV